MAQAMATDSYRSIRSMLAANAARIPDKTYMYAIDQDKSLSFGELHGLASRMAHVLQVRGIRANDRVLMLSENSIEFIATFLGVIRYGATIATANVETTLTQGAPAVINGNGFDTKNGVAVDVFCAFPGGKPPTMFLNPGNPKLAASSVIFTLPASTPTGPGSIEVSNAGGSHSYGSKSNAVSVPIGAAAIPTQTEISAPDDHHAGRRAMEPAHEAIPGRDRHRKHPCGWLPYSFAHQYEWSRPCNFLRI